MTQRQPSDLETDITVERTAIRTVRRVKVEVYLPTSTARALREAIHASCEGECDGSIAELLAHVADDLAYGLERPNTWAGEICRVGDIKRKPNRWREDPDFAGVWRPKGWRRPRRRADHRRPT